MPAKHNEYKLVPSFCLFEDMQSTANKRKQMSMLAGYYHVLVDVCLIVQANITKIRPPPS